MPILHLQFVSQVLHRDACTSWRKLRPNPVFSKAVGGMRIRAVGGATYSVRAAEVAFDLINRKPLVKTHRHSPGETALSQRERCTCVPADLLECNEGNQSISAVATIHLCTSLDEGLTSAPHLRRSSI